ncbi:MAG: hypothetical protein HY913_20860 [Desulfomonile tiedjei]|nr:hypothetical protein [Desulfomonile tiedjei]
MARNNRKYSESRRHTQRHSIEPGTKKLHKDWRLWLVVGLMLAAMFTYVITLDDSIVPAFMRQ